MAKIVANHDADGDYKKNPVILCSLTKAAAAEMAGRGMPLHRSAIGTLHAHAYRSIGPVDVAETHVDDFSREYPSYALSGDVGSIDDMTVGPKVAKPGDALKSAYDLARAKQRPVEALQASVQAFARHWEHWKHENGLLDFTDMILTALREVDTAPGRPDVIIADEAQDMSQLELALLHKWGRAAGATIILGDPYQALFVWRGAHPEMFNNPDIPDDHKKVLRQSYRVPERIRAAAWAWIRKLSTFNPAIEFNPRKDEDGNIVQGTLLRSNGTWKNPLPIIRGAQQHLAQGRSVMVIASCGYMLAPLVALLRKEAIPFSNPWRVARNDWNPLKYRKGGTREKLLAFLRPDIGTTEAPRMWTYAEFYAWTVMLRVKGTMQRLKPTASEQIADAAKGKPDLIVQWSDVERWLEDAAIDSLGDAVEVDEWRDIRFLGEEREWIADYTHPLLDWIMPRIKASRRKQIEYLASVARKNTGRTLVESPKLYVGTCHSVKGGEANCVYLIGDLSGAGMREWQGRPEQRDNVLRTMYVGMTRAKNTLVLCAPASRQAVRW